MRYRMMRKAEAPLVNELIGKTGYYSPVDVSQLGGMVLLAENEEELTACIWVVPTGKIAYCDYLAVLPKYQHTGVGIRLQAYMNKALTLMGTQVIRFWIHSTNTEALKMHTRFGSLLEDGYVLGAYILGEQNG